MIKKKHRSPFTPEIYECVENGQQLVVIEQYIEGRNLEDILYDRELSEEEASSIVCRLCRALEPLHTAQPAIVCRDLKPENMMITPQNQVMLVDFDIARVVSPGKNRDTVVMGTAGFAAPEQFGHRQTDGRSDIYALGTILNYCILRKLPVEKMVDGELGNIVRKCIAVNPDERYQSVRELRYKLEKQYSSEVKGFDETQKEQNGIEDEEHERRGRRVPGVGKIEYKKNEWRRFRPPGFRSGKVWKMILAVIGYFLLIDLSLSLETKDGDVVVTGVRAWLMPLSFFLSQIVEIGIVFDYLGCQKKIFLLNTENRLIRFVIYVVLEIILTVISIFLFVILDDLFW